MTEQKLRIGIQARLKHGDLLEAIRQRGWNQRQAAENLGMSQGTFGKLINLKWMPKKLSADLTKKLLDLTGKLPEDLWPEFVRTPEFQAASKIREILIDVTPRMLAERGLLQLPPAPDELVEQAELKQAVDQLLNSLTPKEADIVRRREYEEETFEEIAKDYRVTGTRIQQIHRRAMARLRYKSWRTQKLRELAK